MPSIGSHSLPVFPTALKLPGAPLSLNEHMTGYMLWPDLHLLARFEAGQVSLRNSARATLVLPSSKFGWPALHANGMLHMCWMGIKCAFIPVLSVHLSGCRRAAFKNTLHQVDQVHDQMPRLPGVVMLKHPAWALEATIYVAGCARITVMAFSIRGSINSQNFIFCHCNFNNSRSARHVFFAFIW